jgi:hypothetical protein
MASMLRADAANAVPDGKTGGPATLPFPTGQARRKDQATDRGALPPSDPPGATSKFPRQGLLRVHAVMGRSPGTPGPGARTAPTPRE